MKPIPLTEEMREQAARFARITKLDSDPMSAKHDESFSEGRCAVTNIDRPSLDRFVNNNADRREGTR